MSGMVSATNRVHLNGCRKCCCVASLDPPAQSEGRNRHTAELSASVEEKLANKTLQSRSNEINKVEWKGGRRLKSFSCFCTSLSNTHEKFFTSSRAFFLHLESIEREKFLIDFFFTSTTCGCSFQSRKLIHHRCLAFGMEDAKWCHVQVHDERNFLSHLTWSEDVWCH